MKRPRQRSDQRQLDLFEGRPPSRREVLPPTPKLVVSDEQWQRSLVLLRERVAHLTIARMKPGVTPELEETMRNDEVSARRAVAWVRKERERLRAGRQI
jgi:hypothetical protein